MNALTIIYWTRVLLGIIAGLLGNLFTAVLGDISIFNGISIALIVYIVSYYVYKPLFVGKVEKQSKILSTGIGAYFLTWIAMFGLFFTLMSPTLTITSPAPNAVLSTGPVTIMAKIVNQIGTTFSNANVNATSPSPANAPLHMTEVTPGTGIYSTTYNITSADSPGQWTIKVQALINGRHREDSITVTIQPSS